MPSVQTTTGVRFLHDRPMTFPIPVPAESQHNEASEDGTAASDFHRAAQEAPDTQAALAERDGAPIAARIPCQSDARSRAENSAHVSFFVDILTQNQ